MGSVAGWDIGGAHLKLAVGDARGRIVEVQQWPCPLWRGIDHLHAALADAKRHLGADLQRHCVTMTGELADTFEDRNSGVRAIAAAALEQLGEPITRFYAGPRGFVAADRVTELSAEIASANWHASAAWLAGRLEHGILLDIGSTTADVVPFGRGAVRARGYSDRERLRFGELVYSGTVRTPVMALARELPLRGEWLGVMAEHFATLADVYRILGQLPVHADQHGTADGGEKTLAASERRLARMLGADADDAAHGDWRHVAGHVRELQLRQLHDACMRQISYTGLDESAPLVAAGVGRLLAPELARRLGRPCIDFGETVAVAGTAPEFAPAECAPAVSLALLGARVDAAWSVV